MNRGSAAWPEIPLGAWEETLTTLHLWSQVVGKLRLAQAPVVNHWWEVPLYVSPRGLTTSAIPRNGRTFDAEFDFLDHRLVFRTSDGRTEATPLEARSVAAFYGDVMGILDRLDLDVTIRTTPNEIPDAIPFDQDTQHASYDPEYANRFWRALLQADRVMKEFRARFLGKCSPVHFFWGGFDHAVTRFSGREAPTHPGGFPNLPDWATREAYSHEVSSAGFWAGPGLGEAAFYSYAYPEPPGFDEWEVTPEAAYYHDDLKEFVLPYEAVRTATHPDDVLMAFFQTTYEAAAELAEWDRQALERPESDLRELERKVRAPA